MTAWHVESKKMTPRGTELTFYWYGPGSGWGTTSGPREHAATFTTKGLAEAALRRVFGTLAEAKRRGYRAAREGNMR